KRLPMSRNAPLGEAPHTAGAVPQFFARYFLPSEPFLTTEQPAVVPLNAVHHRRGAVPERSTTSTLTWSAPRVYDTCVPLQTALMSLGPLTIATNLRIAILQVEPVVSRYL